MAWSIVHPILVAIVIAGAMPLIAGCYQFLLSGLNGYAGVWRRDGVPGVPLPRVAVVVPAWNEAAVIGRTLDTLMALDYPPDRLRVYVVDDASTDATPDVVLGKAAEDPGRVFHLRRAQGG
jgi:cellulose synthase/poly-beta-1,6-N-acetylglucosamine synthase-like glycosyltransferase